MPCTYDPTPAEIAAAEKARAEREKAPLRKQVEQADRRLTASQKEINELKAANNALSVRVDYLQDLIWRIRWNEENILANDAEFYDVEDDIDAVLALQTAHRQSDLDRLVRTLASEKTIDYDRLNKVLAADPSRPLQEQLGFDPDSI